MYFDSCVILSWISDEIDARTGENRAENVQELLDRVSKDKFEIVTSTISVAEVAFAKSEQDGAALDPKIEAKMDALWAVGGRIKLVEFHILIARQARALIRECLEKQPPWKLRPYDAVHLSTAKDRKVDRLYTYSRDLPRFGSLLKVPIEAPPSSGRLPFGRTKSHGDTTANT